VSCFLLDTRIKIGAAIPKDGSCLMQSDISQFFYAKLFCNSRESIDETLFRQIFLKISSHCVSKLFLTRQLDK